MVPQTFLANVFAKPVRVMSPDPGVVVRCYLDGPIDKPVAITAELRDGNRVIKTATAAVTAVEPYHDVILQGLGDIELWNLARPKLYQVTARLDNGDTVTTRMGFREATFTDKGFYLNGEHVKLRGLNRHQTYPYMGAAMPARVQARDAFILRKELKCNIVRTSHYPQSPAFLDACDELGLLVLEEIPGWQHIGDAAWQDLAVDNVDRMIRRDWNHPSIVLWGVRINESADNHEFYTRTNALAHALDDSRQTGGIRNIYGSELLEDVFTMNDFGFPLRPPNHPLYLNTEFNGHMFSTKRFDKVEHVAEHVLRHARVHDQLAGDDRYAGGIAWCAFDYTTHSNFGSGDRICYHGVSDIFRIPKPAAGFYKSQCDPEEEVVIEPGFYYSWGDRGIGQRSGRGADLLQLRSPEDLLRRQVSFRDRPGSQDLPAPQASALHGRVDEPGIPRMGRPEHRGVYRRQAGGYVHTGQPRHRRSPGGETRRHGTRWRWPRRYAGSAGRDRRAGPSAPLCHRGDRPHADGAGGDCRRESIRAGRRGGSDLGGSKEGAGVIKLEAHHQYLGKQAVEIKVRAVEAELV